jgi:hypothetical protein
VATPDEAERAKALISTALEAFLSEDEAWRDRGSGEAVPQLVRSSVEKLCDADGGYKDAALALLAFPAANRVPWDVTDRFDLDRSLSNWLGDLLRAHDIPAVRSALQNSSFRHGFTHERIQNDDLKLVLRWASGDGRTIDEIRAVVDRIIRRRAESAKSVAPLPTLFAPSLVFDRTLAVYERLVAEPSGGAAEQYAFAGLMQAYIETIDERARVESKDVNAADAGRVAGDVQVVRGQADVQEAYEVSTTQWTEKLDQAVNAIRRHGLTRAHVVAAGGEAAGEAIRIELEERISSGQFAETIDVSVLDLHAEMRSLIARLTKSGRKRSIEHTWHWLAQYAPTLTDRLVRAVTGVGVCEA